MRPFAIATVAVFVLAATTAHAQQGQPPVVLAAASLQESLTAAADRWAALGHPKPTLSFAGSSALARQIEAGAPADLFISADEDWMNEVQAKNLIVTSTRVTYLSNRLVVVEPRSANVRVPVRPPAALARVLSAGPLAMADTDAVPAGKYGKAALIKLGAWQQVQPHVVAAENVRAALALVERGAAPLGIVYATDAQASPSTKIAGVFPANSHPPILYPLARLRRSTNAEAEGFRRFLLTGEAKTIFKRYGFTPK